MVAVYRISAIAVMVEVAIQSMSVVFGIAGQGKWIQEGGVLDKAVIEAREFVFPEVIGYLIHGLNGTILIPLTALILLVSSFFTKVPGAVKWASLVLLAVAVQITLGMSASGLPVLGALHGLNALLLLGAAFYAARLVRRSRTADQGDRLASRA
ncbi:hypothetical protein Aph01nite_69870 [Acrocarpospora phusangensis]|uniref:Uncharacterized protein n=1 Tax=Acrocarpospora phusangensis TaxID=1070424 RepID=A0A919QM44_9ACTN|nr:hypothetical protein [Acrocarpospora phusangensis]GIH28677.1 hypothetical protein Aph01nite_69870 [Acrocarpospora phusangensis]